MRARSKLSTGLFAGSFVEVFVAGPALYVSAVIDDEDAFVAVADDVVAQPEVRQAIAVEVTELTFEALEADEAIAELLPEGAQTFSVPLIAIASQQFTKAAFALLDTDVAVEARSSALRDFHRQVTAADRNTSTRERPRRCCAVGRDTRPKQRCDGLPGGRADPPPVRHLERADYGRVDG